MRAFTFLFLLFSTGLYAQWPLKSSFGQAGKISYSFDLADEAVDIITLGSDSLLLLAYSGHPDTMYFNTDIVLVKMDANGNADPAFGQAGVAHYDFDGMDYSIARQLLRCSDGRILVMGAGYSFSNLSYEPVCLMMLGASGVPDSSFGTNGTVKIDFFGGYESPTSVTADVNGNTVITAGSFDTIGNHNLPAVGLFNNYQYADTTFGGTGKLVINFLTGMQPVKMSSAMHLMSGEASAAVPLGDGSLLVGGSYGPDAFIAKFLPGGSLDTLFGNNGYVLFQGETGYNSFVNKMLLLADGSVVVGYSTDKTYDRDHYIAKIDTASGVMYSFEYVDFASYEDMLSGMIVTAQGKIIEAGRCIKPQHAFTNGYRSDYFAVTIFNDPSQLFQQQKLLVQFDSLYQSGAVAVTIQSDGTIVCAGFTYTSTPGATDVALIAIDPGYYSGVNELLDEHYIYAYPNPFHDRLRLENLVPGSLVELRDISGRILLSAISPTETTRLSLESFAPGIYFISVKGFGYGKVIKIVKE